MEFQKVYDNEIKAFMADVKSWLGRGSDIRKGNIVGSGLLKVIFVDIIWISVNDLFLTSMVVLKLIFEVVILVLQLFVVCLLH